MKISILALLIASLVGLSMSPSNAFADEASAVAKLAAELNKSQAAINAIEKQIVEARASRRAALWIGIPVTGVASVFAMLSGMAEGLSTTGRNVEAHAMSRQSAALAGAAGASTIAWFHIKGNQLDELQRQLDQAKAQNTAALDALTAMARD